MSEQVVFPVEQRSGSWLIRVRRGEGDTLVQFVVDSTWDEAERLVQWIWNSHPASGEPIQRLTVEEARVKLAQILDGMID